MAEITLKDVTKRYPDGTEAVKKMSLDIKDGEFMILVGPSGCGKSTALRMIAGLEDISEGEMRIGDKVVNNLAPRDRDIAMVFQNYALYPHMTVRANMGFALKLAKVDEAEINQKVEEAARILDLTEHLDRKPANLSGGQRQRVAMGRAIVRDPQAFLMDEPLSNLDAKLRVQTRTEVSRLQKRLSTTMVYVTHDQTEAMTLGDRVAVMRSGVLQQVAPPRELYNDPVNIFVAGFIGSPAMNFFSGTISGGKLKLPFAEVPAPKGVSHSGDVIVGIRPEDFEDAALAPSGHTAGVEFTAPIEVVESMGSEIYVYFGFQGGEVSSDELAELARDSGVAETPGAGAGLAVARLNPESEIGEGQKAKLWFDSAKLHLFDPGDGSNVRRSAGEQKAAAKATKAAVKAEAEVEARPEAVTAGADASERQPAVVDTRRYEVRRRAGCAGSRLTALRAPGYCASSGFQTNAGARRATWCRRGRRQGGRAMKMRRTTAMGLGAAVAVSAGLVVAAIASAAAFSAERDHDAQAGGHAEGPAMGRSGRRQGGTRSVHRQAGGGWAHADVADHVLQGAGKRDRGRPHRPPRQVRRDPGAAVHRLQVRPEGAPEAQAKLRGAVSPEEHLGDAHHAALSQRRRPRADQAALGAGARRTRRRLASGAARRTKKVGYPALAVAGRRWRVYGPSANRWDGVAGPGIGVNLIAQGGRDAVRSSPCQPSDGSRSPSEGSPGGRCRRPLRARRGMLALLVVAGVLTPALLGVHRDRRGDPVQLPDGRRPAGRERRQQRSEST